MKKRSTLFFTLLLTGSAFAQIPNASFESWTAHTGYDTPDQWGNPNPYTTLAGVYVCEKGTPGASGTYYMKLTAKTVPLVGVVPGVAGTGTAALSGTTFSVSGGFAYTSRPASITGQWQFAPTGTDTGHVIVLLSRWNIAAGKKDTVAYTDHALTGSVTSWTAFTVGLNYYSGKYPDTALIILSSSKLPPATATAGSYLYMDALAFAGNVPSGVVTVTNNAAPTIIYPNPATGNTSVFYYSTYGGNVTLGIYDVNGKQVKSLNLIASTGDNTFPVNVSKLPQGMYILRITDELGGMAEKKLIIE